MWPFWGKSASGFSAASTAEEVTQGIDATSLTVIITGASSGIGAETARVLALRGARVILAVRNTAAGRRTREMILEEIPSAKVDVMELDVSSMASVKSFASLFISTGLPLNVLINNAGVCQLPYQLSADGIEMQFATNHVGHFLLTDLLLDTMKETARRSNVEGRILNVSSAAHYSFFWQGIDFERINDESSYGAFSGYRVSKLANILHTNELSRRLREEGANVTANSLHPGLINTKIVDHLPPNRSIFMRIVMLISLLYLKDIHQGAATTCYVALHPQVEGVGGQYFVNCNLAKPCGLATDAKLAKKLWDFTRDLVK
uniref:Short-chain dehydrogenase TIC 32, chloroplastic n=1 Tax=Kalanchoe fedtschenkoi TaxID=63787 RepID=A0A7N0U6A5_KALFE